jgi:hypothetical protein
MMLRWVQYFTDIACSALGSCRSFTNKQELLIKMKNSCNSIKKISVRNGIASFLLVLAVLMSACSSGAAQTESMPQTQDQAMMDENPTEAMMEAETTHEPTKEPTQEGILEDGTHEPMLDTTEEPMDNGLDAPDSGEEMMETPDWFAVQLQNINSDESFTIQDLKGKVVLVETMAIWCSNCLQQQRQVKALHELIGERDDFVSLGLDIDPNENADDLKGFVDRNGFDWVYAVAPAEVSRNLSNLYGAQFLNPPSTPMLIVDRHGEVHPLPFGIKDAQTLMDALEPFLAESM